MGPRISSRVLSCLGDYVSVTVWYDETVVASFSSFRPAASYAVHISSE